MFQRPGGLNFAALQFKGGKFFMVFELTEAAVGEVRAWPSDSLPCCARAQQALALPECETLQQPFSKIPDHLHTTPVHPTTYIPDSSI